LYFFRKAKRQTPARSGQPDFLGDCFNARRQAPNISMVGQLARREWFLGIQAFSNGGQALVETAGSVVFKLVAERARPECLFWIGWLQQILMSTLIPNQGDNLAPKPGRYGQPQRAVL
jgi:hypothetical protein